MRVFPRWLPLGGNPHLKAVLICPSHHPNILEYEFWVTAAGSRLSLDVAVFHLAKHGRWFNKRCNLRLYCKNSHGKQVNSPTTLNFVENRKSAPKTTATQTIAPQQWCTVSVTVKKCYWHLYQVLISPVQLTSALLSFVGWFLKVTASGPVSVCTASPSWNVRRKANEWPGKPAFKNAKNGWIRTDKRAGLEDGK